MSATDNALADLEANSQAIASANQQQQYQDRPSHQ